MDIFEPLAPNFNLSEFISDDTADYYMKFGVFRTLSWYDTQEIIRKYRYLANRLQVVRDLTGSPIIINRRPDRLYSGYRTKEEHKKVYQRLFDMGEIKTLKIPWNSQHLIGGAADCISEGMPATEFQALLTNWTGGLGSYADFTHLDIGPKRRW